MESTTNGFEKGETIGYEVLRVDVEQVISKTEKERLGVGAFILTNRRILWKPSNVSAASISIPYQVVQGQQESKKDLRLRLTLKEPVEAATSYVYKFETGDEHEKAKNLIMKKLTLIKQKAVEVKDAGSAVEIEIRKKILLNNAELRKIHKSLVVDKQFLEEEEFWSLHQNLISQEEEKLQQQRGPSNQLLADVRATTEGQSGSIGFKIDSKVTESIFRLFPGVKRSYEEYVPDKISREKFWSIYFQADFFYRKMEKGTIGTEEQMFERYQRELEEEIRRSKKQRVDTGVLTDLSRTEEDHPESFVKRLDSSLQSGTIHKTFQVASRLHHHANIVLHPDALQSGPWLIHAETPENQDIKLANVIDDLERPQHADSIPLDIADEKQYFESQLIGDMKSSAKPTSLDTPKLQDGVRRVETWNPSLNASFLKTKISIELLTKLFPKADTQANPKAQQVIDEDIRLIHLKLSELLRFYWANSGDPQRAHKIANRLKEQRQELVGLREVREAGTTSYEMILAMIGTIDKVLKNAN